MNPRFVHWTSFASLLWILGALAAHAHNGTSTPLPQPPQLAQAASESPTPAGEAPCALTLRLLEGDGEVVRAGVIHVATSGGQTIHPAELLPRTATFSDRSLGEAAFAYMNRWYVLPGERTLSLPRAPLSITAFSGIGTRLAAVEIDLTGKASESLAIPVSPLADWVAGNGVPGNVHLHLKGMSLGEAERYATEIAMGDGLDVVFLSYLERAEADRDYISNTFTLQDLNRFRESSGVLFGYGEEYRHNFPRAEGYGHVMFLDLPKLILPASFGQPIMKRGNDDGVLRTGIEAARDQKATVLWCHNTRGLEDIPNWVAGLIDGQIIFDSGATGDYESGIYRYLNVGLRVPISMGTDWHYNDMALTMVHEAEPLTTASWLEALRAGRSYITNGPLLDFNVNGLTPGHTLELPASEAVQVSARAVCRNDFHALELVANGAVVARAETVREDGAYGATLEVAVTVDTSTWLALRAAPFTGSYDQPEAVNAGFNEYGKPLFAHTSPVYVSVGGAPIFLPEAAESLIAELRASMVTIRHTGDYTNENERDKVLAIYENAQRVLKEKLAR